MEIYSEFLKSNEGKNGESKINVQNTKYDELILNDNI